MPRERFKHRTRQLYSRELPTIAFEVKTDASSVLGVRFRETRRRATSGGIHHPIIRSPSSTRVPGFLRPREPAGSKTVRPTLRPVINAQDLDCRSLKPIGDDVG